MIGTISTKLYSKSGKWLSSQEALMGDGSCRGMFQMPEADANMLSFASFDLLARVEALQAAICVCAADRQAA